MFIKVTEKELEDALIDRIKTCDRDDLRAITQHLFGGTYHWEYEVNKDIELEKDFIYMLEPNDEYAGEFGWGDEIN